MTTPSYPEYDLTLEQMIDGAGPANWGQKFTKNLYNNVYPAIEPSNNKLPANYTVVITGAGKGIGKFIAKAYAKAGAGHIIITARTASDLEKVKKALLEINPKVQVDAVPGDATKPESYTPIVKLLEGKRLDCIVNNAGGGGDITGNPFAATIHETSPADFALTTNVNYLSAFNVSNALLPTMLATPDSAKTVINITSAASHMVAGALMAYNISKLAVNRLTEIIAAGYREHNVTAVALHPGTVLTPAVEKIPYLVPFMKDDINLCGSLCTWISKEKPHYLSGRYMTVNWDVEELQARQKEIVEGDKLKWKMVV